MKALITLNNILLCFLISLAACKKPDEKALEPKMSVGITNMTGNYEQVNVYVKSMQVQYNNVSDSEGWKTLNTSTGLYNLIAMKDGSSRSLVLKEILPQGKIKRLRLCLADSGSLMLNDHSVVDLSLTDGVEQNVEINLESELAANRETLVTLNFDAALSVRQNDLGAYTLAPSVNVKTVFSRSGNNLD